MEMLPQPEAEKALAWLEDRKIDGLTGYAPNGWARSVWIPHAMYETDALPGGITHDDVARIERASGTPTVPPTGDPVLDARLEHLEQVIEASTTVIGATLGASREPGQGWKRLLWSELASRLDIDPYAVEVPPCHRSFPYRSWPANIAPPAEGSIDKEQFLALVEILAEQNGSTADTVCFAYRCPVGTGDFERRTVYRCNLHELPDLYDESEHSLGAPTNIWPADHSWFTYSDADLWATKASGSDNLITRLHTDPLLETVALPL